MGAAAVLFLMGTVNAYTVSGSVKDGDGKAVSGANVMLLTKGKTAVTGTNGGIHLARR